MLDFGMIAPAEISPHTGSMKNENCQIDLSDIYREDQAFRRAVNDILHKAPTVQAGIIGAVWMGAASEFGRPYAPGLLLLAAALAVAGAFSVWRLKLAFDDCLNRTQRFEGVHGRTLRGRSWVPSIFRIQISMLAFVAALSAIGASIEIWTRVAASIP